MASAKLEFRKVTFRYGQDSVPVLRELDLLIRPGDAAALVGPNGVGKSTLLRLAAGTLLPQSGSVYLDGGELAKFSARERARRIAVVPQHTHIPFAFTVWEVVMLGRTPYLDPLRGESRKDREAAERAMELTGTLYLARRPFGELSGGERQLVILARALAQQPELLLLDEPTANLDIAHQATVLQLLRELNQSAGVTVLAAIHDLNLAALFFQRTIMLYQGTVIADGTPRQVFQVPVIESVFGGRVKVLDHPTSDAPLIVVAPDHQPSQ